MVLYTEALPFRAGIKEMFQRASTANVVSFQTPVPRDMRLPLPHPVKIGHDMHHGLPVL